MHICNVYPLYTHLSLYISLSLSIYIYINTNNIMSTVHAIHAIICPKLSILVGASRSAERPAKASCHSRFYPEDLAYISVDGPSPSSLPSAARASFGLRRAQSTPLFQGMRQENSLESFAESPENSLRTSPFAPAAARSRPRLGAGTALPPTPCPPRVRAPCRCRGRGCRRPASSRPPSWARRPASSRAPSANLPLSRPLPPHVCVSPPTHVHDR